MSSDSVEGDLGDLEDTGVGRACTTTYLYLFEDEAQA